MQELLLRLPTWFTVLVAFVFGANLGSFFNVVIARLPFDQSIVWPPSHCMTCAQPIKPFHNVPILSWFLLRGRCASCLAPFSIRYALIELAYALVCAFAVVRNGPTLPALHEAVLLGYLLCLAAIDLDWWILPHELTRSGIAVGLALAWAIERSVFYNALLAAAVGYSMLVLVGFIGERIFKREALGGGDPWLMAMLGAFLGLDALLPIILLASVQGTFIGGALLLVRRRREATEPPAPAAAPQPEPPSSPEPPGAAGEVHGALPPHPAADEDALTWEPPPTGVPMGPFLALAAAEVLYFPGVRRLFPIMDVIEALRN